MAKRARRQEEALIPPGLHACLYSSSIPPDRSKGVGNDVEICVGAILDIAHDQLRLLNAISLSSRNLLLQ